MCKILCLNQQYWFVYFFIYFLYFFVVRCFCFVFVCLDNSSVNILIVLLNRLWSVDIFLKKNPPQPHPTPPQNKICHHCSFSVHDKTNLFTLFLFILNSVSIEGLITGLIITSVLILQMNSFVCFAWTCACVCMSLYVVVFNEIKMWVMVNVRSADLNVGIFSDTVNVKW